MKLTSNDDVGGDVNLSAMTGEREGLFIYTHQHCGWLFIAVEHTLCIFKATVTRYEMLYVMFQEGEQRINEGGAQRQTVEPVSELIIMFFSHCSRCLRQTEVSEPASGDAGDNGTVLSHGGETSNRLHTRTV